MAYPRHVDVRTGAEPVGEVALEVHAARVPAEVGPLHDALLIQEVARDQVPGATAAPREGERVILLGRRPEEQAGIVGSARAGHFLVRVLR